MTSRERSHVDPMLFLTITDIARNANDSYSSLVDFRLVACWLAQIVNIGMTLHPMPSTG
jgi:cell division protein FtsW (lipid II flippase)